MADMEFVGTDPIHRGCDVKGVTLNICSSKNPNVRLMSLFIFKTRLLSSKSPYGKKYHHFMMQSQSFRRNPNIYESMNIFLLAWETKTRKNVNLIELVGFVGAF